MIIYLLGIALGYVGILIFNPVLTLIGIGLTLTIFLPKGEDHERTL